MALEDAQANGGSSRHATPLPMSRLAETVRGPRLAIRLVSNYVFQTMNWGIRLFEQLLLIPLYILAWGTELYRDWLLLFSVMAFLNLCSFGVDDYFGNVFLRSAATGDRAGLIRHLRVGLFVSLVITVGMLGLAGLMAIAVPLHRVLGLSAMDERTATSCFLIMAAPLSVLYVTETLRGLYRAFGDFSRGECLFAIFNSVQIAAVAIVLATRQPPLAVALCYGILPFLYAIGQVIDLVRRYRQVTFGLAMPTRTELRETVRQSLLYFTTPLSMILTQNVTLLAFGVLGISAAATVKYNVLRVFTGLSRQVGAQSFVVGSGIEMARQHAQADHAAWRKLYADSCRIVACFVGILAGVSIPLSGPFVDLWTHHAVASDTTMILWFLAGIFASAPGRVSVMLLRYINQPYPIAISNTIQALGGLALAMVLVPGHGVIGAAAGFAIAEALGVGIYPAIIVQRTLHFGALRQLLRSLAAGIAAFAVSYAVAAMLFHGGSIGFVALGGRLVLWALIVVPPAAVLVLSRAQRTQLRTLFIRRFFRPPVV